LSLSFKMSPAERLGAQIKLRSISLPQLDLIG
jgi:hypothetical protein